LREFVAQGQAQLEFEIIAHSVMPVAAAWQRMRQHIT
jgi:hypothetical protein